MQCIHDKREGKSGICLIVHIASSTFHPPFAYSSRLSRFNEHSWLISRLEFDYFNTIYLNISNII